MKVGIIGLGYVGLPLAVAFAEAGHAVVGLDSDARKVERLRDGRSDVEDVPGERLSALGDSFAPTTDRGELAECDAVLICVPTPLANHREPDLTYLVDAATSLSGVLREGQLVVLESTTYPGTTRDRLKPILEESGLAAGRDFHLAYSPERIDPGRTDYTIRTTPKIVGGLTDACRDRRSSSTARSARRSSPVSGPEAAELTKLLENIFRSVNIALVNELARLCDRMEIDVWEVVEAAGTKPFGFMPFEPGPGMGGHCLPVDPFYLAFAAREHDFYTEFIELAGKINQTQPRFCVRKIERDAQRGRKARQGLAHPAAGRRLQGGRRGPARVAGAQDHPPAARAGSGRQLPRPPRSRGRRARPRIGRPRRGAPECRPRLRDHRASGDRLRAGRRRGAARARLPRRHPRHTRREPREALRLDAWHC